MPSANALGPYTATETLPEHLADWRLPPAWRWGASGLAADFRHYQEIIDALGRSLSLVTAPNPTHASWLADEARQLAHLGHPSIPTTYHYWTSHREARRGPGYLRRWIAGETIRARMTREGAENDVASVLQVLRAAGSALVYMHQAGSVYGAMSPDCIWVTPSAHVWLSHWQWALPRAEIPSGATPDARWMPVPPEWVNAEWAPTIMSDQWQLAATCFAALTGEPLPTDDVPPLQWVRPDIPQDVARALDRALLPQPRDRHHSIAGLLRAVDRAVGSRSVFIAGTGDEPKQAFEEAEEARLRRALGDDYDVLASLGSGTFGSVWRARDLALDREVALKMLHPSVSRDNRAVSRFRREARLAAQLAHPAIVPIYDWDRRGDVAWYTMELAEGGSLEDLISGSGKLAFVDIAPQIDLVLDGLSTAHANGIVHRDLKPENILLDRYRRWRMADFGIANLPGEEAAGTTGTPAFAPPEQLLGEVQGPQADCFAMAAIVVYVLTGSPPFGSDDAKAILARQLSDRPDLEGIQREVAVWIRRALSPSADKRYAEASEMLMAFRSVIAKLARREVPLWRRWLSRRTDFTQQERENRV